MAPRKSPGSKTTVLKPTKKKTVSKKKAKKKAARKTAEKKTLKKKLINRTRSMRSSSPAVKEPVVVQPGPPGGSIPPVEEPARHEEAVGIVTHYYSHLGVAVVQVNQGSIAIGNTIHIVGHTTDIMQTITSMEYEHLHVEQAAPGQSVGIKIEGHAREHDIVYLVK